MVTRSCPRHWLAPVATVLVVACLGAACSTTSGPDDPASPDPEGGAEVPSDPPPFTPLPSDQAGGPEHTSPIATQPTDEQLVAAASGAPTRLDAEVFALSLTHAIENQTPDATTELETFYAADLPEVALTAITDSRQFPGNHVAADERAWLRSEWVAGPPAVADVHVVEKVISPMMGVESEPFVFWSATRLSVTYDGGGWRLSDFRQGLASESAEFSPWTWEGTMNSGKGWRRVALS